jgi:hypothetical protein
VSRRSILQGPLAKVVAKAMAPVAVDLVYQQVSQVLVDADKPWAGTTESVQVHRCRGWTETFNRNLERTVVKAGDLRVMILAETLNVQPETSGRIVVDGRTLAIVDVRRDPAGATFDVQVRR